MLIPALALLLAALPRAEGAIRVLLVSGSGADERAAAAMLGDALRRDGRFAVFTSDDPGLISAAALSRYDALALDCCGTPWSDSFRRAVSRFVERGKGLAAVRAGDCAALPGAAPAPALDKPGNQVLRVRWTGGDYSTVDDPGPGLSPSRDSTVLASGRADGQDAGEQPLAWRSALGKGRLFYTRLGRNPAVRQEPEFLAAFVRGVEWAATGAVSPPLAASTVRNVRALVVTGGHDYDPSFYTLFEDQPGLTGNIDPHPAPYRKGDLRKRYDTLVLYDSMQVIDEVERKNLMTFVESGKGVVILHHALVDYSDMSWWWEEVMGARWLKVGGPGTRWKTTWKHDVELLVYPVGEHPVTAGVGPMRIWDETYKGMWLSPDIQVLMRTDHPTSDGPVVWISPYRKSRVVIIELGHDRKAHLHPAYRKLVRNAILWSAGME